MKNWKQAANLAYTLAKHFCFVSEDCNPANYTDDQHDTWLATIRQEIHESTQNPIVCNNCDWEGKEHDLEHFIDQNGYGKGCPNCHTDAYLQNVIP